MNKLEDAAQIVEKSAVPAVRDSKAEFGCQSRSRKLTNQRGYIGGGGWTRTNPKHHTLTRHQFRPSSERRGKRPTGASSPCVFLGRRQDDHLGTLGGPIRVGAGINNSSEVVVGADTPLFGGLQSTMCATTAICRMFVWRKGVKVVPDLGTLEGGTDTAIYDLLSFGQGTSFINNRHQVIGQADIPITDPNNPPFAISRAFLWDRGLITDLGVLGDGHNVSASAINDESQVVGDSEFTSGPDPVLTFPPFHAFLWDKGAMTDLEAFPGAKLSIALGISNAGQVVGLSTVPGDADFHTAVWSKGTLTDLGTFPGDSDSAANAVNQRGQTVGFSGGPTTMRAMLWENGVGIDLNTRIPASSGWQLLYAIGINARGQITGWGIHNNPNGLSAFLLTPTNDRIDSPGQSARAITGTVLERKGITLRQLFRHRLAEELRTKN